MGGTVSLFIQIRLSKFKPLRRTIATSIFKDPDVAVTLPIIHDKSFVLLGGKAQIYIFFACKNITNIAY